MAHDPFQRQTKPITSQSAKRRATCARSYCARSTLTDTKQMALDRRVICPHIRSNSPKGLASRNAGTVSKPLRS
jgi:hypothetical protein